MAPNLTLVALLAAAAGFVLQMMAGITDTPTIPPALVVLLAAARLGDGGLALAETVGARAHRRHTAHP